MPLGAPPGRHLQVLKTLVLARQEAVNLKVKYQVAGGVLAALDNKLPSVDLGELRVGAEQLIGLGLCLARGFSRCMAASGPVTASRTVSAYPRTVAASGTVAASRTAVWLGTWRKRRQGVDGADGDEFSLHDGRCCWVRSVAPSTFGIFRMQRFG
jgi:hypothetical protein